MAFKVRISKSGTNAETNTDPKNFTLFADSDNVLIKEYSRGSSDVATASTISHNLGYIPFYIIMGKTSSTRYRVATAYNQLAGLWRTSTTTSTISITEGASAYDDYLYYIFYDDFS